MQPSKNALTHTLLWPYSQNVNPKGSNFFAFQVFAERPNILHNVVQGLSIEFIPLQMAEMKRSFRRHIIDFLSIFVPRLRNITLVGRGSVAWHNLDEAFQMAFLNCLL